MTQAVADKLLEIQALLIEDSRTDALACIKKVQHEDDGRLHFHHVENFQQGLDYLDKHMVDIILLDLGLPDSEGIDSIYTLNQKHPTLPIVILTGREDELTIIRALQYGAQEFLLKGECSGAMIRQSLFSAIFRKSLKK